MTKDVTELRSSYWPAGAGRASERRRGRQQVGPGRGAGDRELGQHGRITIGSRGRSPWLTAGAGQTDWTEKSSAPSSDADSRRHDGLVVGGPDRHPQRAVGRLVAGVERAQQVAVGVPAAGRPPGRCPEPTSPPSAARSVPWCGEPSVTTRRARRAAAVVARPRAGRPRRRPSSRPRRPTRAPVRCSAAIDRLAQVAACSSRSPVPSPRQVHDRHVPALARSASASTSSAGRRAAVPGHEQHRPRRRPATPASPPRPPGYTAAPAAGHGDQGEQPRVPSTNLFRAGESPSSTVRS